jgi:Holliday junction DNA helicase RuvA
MIAALSGKVLSKSLDRAVIDVSGVGYEVFLTTDALARLHGRNDADDDVFVHVHTQVREDAIVLYGFLEVEEKEMFLHLISVSGVGPKLGLAALSGMRVGDLSRAIAGGDVKQLTSLQGVGRKTAERICVELKDKVGYLASGAPLEAGELTRGAEPGTTSAVADVLSALGNLGYSDPVSRKSLTAVKRRLGDERFYGLSVEELLRECLRSLA